MIVLDENFGDDQFRVLRSWRIPCRRIGHELGRKGMKDDEIIPFLIQQSRLTFFSRDSDWYNRNLLHPRYGIFLLAVEPDESAIFLRRVLRHPQLDTQAKRLGKVIRASHYGLTGWMIAADSERNWLWP